MKKVLILCGGSSNENKVSVLSAINIYNSLKGYYKKIIYLNNANTPFEFEDTDFKKYVDEKKLKVGFVPPIGEKIVDFQEFLKDFDIVLPILHGQYGEDGKIQSFLEKLNIKYIGCDSISSAMCWDKFKAKAMAEINKISVAPYLLLNFNKKYDPESESDLEELQNFLESKYPDIYSDLLEFRYPVFVKPNRSGSSIAVTKVKRMDDIIKAIALATQVDREVLIEKNIKGFEVEVAILENGNEIIASNIGYITQNNFYNFDEKYVLSNITPKIINNPEELKELCKFDDLDSAKNKIKEIKEKAIKIFKILGCKDLSRVDFFLENGEVIFNEINTMPGFTNISMYPKLMEDISYKTPELLKLIIENNLKNNKY